jgi:type II secretory pathway pseudopilin PulG
MLTCNLLVAAALTSLNPSGHSNSRALEATNCTNTCNHALDGMCDDGGHGSEYTICAHGSDCVDCGPPTESSESSGEWWISFLLTQDIVHLSGGLSPSILEANAMLQIRFPGGPLPRRA